MFDPRAFYAQENAPVEASYARTLEAIGAIVARTGDYETAGSKREYYRCFNRLGRTLLACAALEKRLDDSYLSTRGLLELQEEFNTLSAEVLPGAYEHSFLNPTYAVSVLGEQAGKLLYPFCARGLRYREAAFDHAIYRMEAENRLFIGLFDCIDDAGLDSERALAVIRDAETADSLRDALVELRKRHDPAYRRYRDIVEASDLSDLRYLFKYGCTIGDTEIRTAQWLLSCPAETIARLSRQIVSGYVAGFANDNKDLSIKSTALIMFGAGYERLVRQIIRDLKAVNLEALVAAPTASPINKQFEYDHRFADAPYFDRAYAEKVETAHRESREQLRDVLSKFSGRVILMTFGERPLLPEQKTQAWAYSAEQLELLKAHRARLRRIDDLYAPRQETSYTGIAFPGPAVGEHFEEIWTDFARVNLLDSETYERIQKRIIDVLDQAAYIHIRGAGGNTTDLRVRMHALRNPAVETNFLNGGATVNIPVGEVFTSPQLSGTNGILHVRDIYLAGFRYVNLRLTFQDGVTSQCTCDNYPSPAENARYLKENLFSHYDTLPMGEFAIGTNTLAYIVVQKHDLSSVLPVLIAEKTGTHFAIGDPCFARSEDLPVFNPIDRKEVTARGNERTARRREDPDGSYVNYHMDITLPYEDIAFVTAVTPAGRRIDVIRDGRFVAPGTEELNAPLA
jgi:aminopeptidase